MSSRSFHEKTHKSHVSHKARRAEGLAEAGPILATPRRAITQPHEVIRTRPFSIVPQQLPEIIDRHRQDNHGSDEDTLPVGVNSEEQQTVP